MEQPESREAGAPQTSERANASLYASLDCKRRLTVATIAFCVAFNFKPQLEAREMRIIHVSGAALVTWAKLQASLQVALHFTKRQNGAKASNRVSVSGCISGRDDSQEALSNAAADGAFGRWSGRFNASGAPKYGV